MVHLQGLINDFGAVIGIEPSPNSALYLSSLLVFLCVPLLLVFSSSSRPRQTQIPPYRERVCILGASTGVGRELALAYARRGCRQLLLVARRKDALQLVRNECEKAFESSQEWQMSEKAPGWESTMQKEKFKIVAADCAEPSELATVRDVVLQEFGGLDTLHIVFGISSLRSLLGIAGVDPLRPSPAVRSSSPHAVSESEALNKFDNIHATSAGIEAVQKVSESLARINFAATASALSMFVPILQTTSIAPSAALISSLAAIVPAPTRSLYCATKAAQLQLFFSVALEGDAQCNASSTALPLQSPDKTTPSHSQVFRRRISMLALCPSTIRTDFRKSAADAIPGVVLEASYDSSWKSSGSSGSSILSTEEVTERAILGVDQYTHGCVYLPKTMALVPYLSLICPSLIERVAHKKYGY